MRIICDCGNEETFDTIDEETGGQTRTTLDEGQYARIDTFKMWEMHDVVGIVCEKCGKAIWLFT